MSISRNRSPAKPIITFLLTDHSINKATYEKTKTNRMIKIAKNKESKLLTQKGVRVVAQQCRKIQENWENFVKTELQLDSQKKKISENSAVKIQKIVRGFLVRIRIDSVLLSQREARSIQVIKELRSQTDFCMLTLGSNTVPAVRKIQSAYRRFQFRKKLEILNLCYKLHLKEREEIVCDLLKTYILVFNCRLKKSYLEFLQYRAKRMEEIKRKIAILTVKKIWRAKKLSFKIIKEKFIKIKRRKAALQNKEAYEKYLASLGGKKPGSSENPEKMRDSSEGKLEKKLEQESDEKEENPEEDKEYKEAQRIKEIIEQKIRQKVAMSKLAYAVPGHVTKVHMPLMQEIALAESLDNEALQSKLLVNTASVFAKGQVLDRVSVKNYERNLQIMTPKAVSQRYHYNKSALTPLLIISPANEVREQHTARNYKQVYDEHFLSSTVSINNKMEPPVVPEWKLREIERSKIRRRHRGYTEEESDEDSAEVKRTTRETRLKPRTNHWVPVARRFFSYVPALDNSNYVPQKWSPVALDRKILKNRMPKIEERRMASTAVSPSVIPSNELIKLSAPVKRRNLMKDVLNSFSPSTQEHSIDFSSLMSS